MTRRALITGITGQDGSYLTELLLSKGYEVHGLVRRSSSENQTWRIDHLHAGTGMASSRLVLHEGDLLDEASLVRAVLGSAPDEVYNLASQSHVATSFKAQVYTGEVGALGAARLLEAVRQAAPAARFYQASTSEMFGNRAPPQDEQTPFWPRSPYGAAKLYAHWMTVNAREAYGMHASAGILFNHESPRRGERFVTRKVTIGAARAKLGLSKGKLRLGNLDAERDWGHARDYVRAMWLMVQQPAPGDYVVGTGQTRTVAELVELAFRRVGLDWREHVEVDPSLCRPADVEKLCGDATKAREVLGWRPEVSFEELVAEMVDGDLELLHP